mgnify:CR=1 FL=1
MNYPIKRTTKDILGDFIDNELTIEYIEKTNDDIPIKEMDVYLEKRISYKKEMREKIDRVDHFVLDVKRKEHLIDAEVEALKAEIERLKGRRRAVGNFKRFVNDFLLPMVIKEVGTDDGIWETDTARYKLYQTYGPVDVNPDKISNEFKKVEIKESIDKVKARNAAITAHKSGNDMPEGIDIKRVDKVRRT